MPTRGLREIVGYSREQLGSMSIHDLIHPQDRDECQRLERQLIEGRLQHFNVTQRMVRERWRRDLVEFWVSPLQSVDGRPSGYHFGACSMDVTERRRMQQQLQAREAYSSEMLRYMPVGWSSSGRWATSSCEPPVRGDDGLGAKRYVR